MFGVVGFLIGLGFANYPISRLLGRPPSLREKEEQGISRYFGLCTDHKVVGMQYLVGIGVFFFVGGLNAMLIRTELLHTTPTVVGPNQYLSLVGMHGTMMMGMMTSGILGPFANYFVPIMIGARRMAFPRIEALTFWLLMAAGFILASTIFFGGFPTGWTGYEPLNDQAVMGMDSYIIFFALVGISMALLGLNMMATIITMRAPGHDLVAAADLRVVGVRDRDPDGAGGADADRDADDGGAGSHDQHHASSSPAAAAAPTCSRTCSGSSATPRCTSSRCRASGSCSSCCRCSRASRCGVTGWPCRGCSA